jgi:hypothetical protein
MTANAGDPNIKNAGIATSIRKLPLEAILQNEKTSGFMIDYPSIN